MDALANHSVWDHGGFAAMTLRRIGYGIACIAIGAPLYGGMLMLAAMMLLSLFAPEIRKVLEW